MTDRGVVRSVWLGVGILVGMLIAAAHGQEAPAWPVPVVPPAGGFSLAPDGGVSSWQDGSGYTVAPEGQGSWDQNGGYFISPDGGYSTWTGPQVPVVPVVLPDGQVIVVPQ